MITLIGTTTAVNDIGDIVETKTEREVFAEVRSVGSKRKMEAMALGLSLAWKFVLADYYDYQDEEQVIYDDKTYDIVDTFRRDDNGIELTASRCKNGSSV